MALTTGLLIVWFSRTGASEQLSLAAETAARTAWAEVGEDGQGPPPSRGREPVRRCRCEDVDEADLRGAAGYLFVAPENLASLAGAMKECFDRLYYPLLGRLEGRPYAQVIAAGTDGQGAARQLARIATGWRLKAVADPLIVLTGAQTAAQIAAPKTVSAEQLALAGELAAGLASGIALGIF